MVGPGHLKHQVLASILKLLLELCPQCVEAGIDGCHDALVGISISKPLAGTELPVSGGAVALLP